MENLCATIQFQNINISTYHFCYKSFLSCTKLELLVCHERSIELGLGMVAPTFSDGVKEKRCATQQNVKHN